MIDLEKPFAFSCLSALANAVTLSRDATRPDFTDARVTVPSPEAPLVMFAEPIRFDFTDDDNCDAASFRVLSLSRALPSDAVTDVSCFSYLISERPTELRCLSNDDSVFPENAA